MIPVGVRRMTVNGATAWYCHACLKPVIGATDATDGAFLAHAYRWHREHNCPYDSLYGAEAPPPEDNLDFEVYVEDTDQLDADEDDDDA